MQAMQKKNNSLYMRIANSVRYFFRNVIPIAFAKMHCFRMNVAAPVLLAQEMVRSTHLTGRNWKTKGRSAIDIKIVVFGAL